MLAAIFVVAMPSSITIIDRPAAGPNSHYPSYRSPLKNTPLTPLPITAFRPGGWLKKALELQRDGLTGQLGEISKWLAKQDNAWLNASGTGSFGWEEVPYWLRGYSRVGYVLRDPQMSEETRVWVEGTIKSARPDGDFGPIHNHGKGFRDLWAQMLMLQVLQSWHDFTGDKRVLKLMTNYFKWQLAIPEAKFLKDYWENSRGADNLASVYWLYNRTREPFLLDLAKKIDRNTADWRALGRLPNFHVVNIAQCFRAPATFWLQSGRADDLQASYRNFDFIREKYGQVPGGMFGADENARPGHDDPHQASETCSFVEQIGSNAFMMSITADPKWVTNTEEVAFNSWPAALTSDYRALRYLTAPNQVISDAKNHAPGVANAGPFMLMNPFSSRCCQHNHTSGWVNYLEGSWMATGDGGLAGVLYHEGSVTAKVGQASEVTITSTTRYPFEETIRMRVAIGRAAEFPLYFLIPEWASGATFKVGKDAIKGQPGKYVRVEREWRDGDSIEIKLPMRPRVKVWDQMKNSVTVYYGPLGFSLKIGEKFTRVDGTKNAQWDSGWQSGADPSKWPTYEITPTTPWNYGLPAKPKFTVVRRAWPGDNNPFTQASTPIEIRTQGRQIPEWRIDQDGLVGILPQSPVHVDTPIEEITLVPMGAARLRISSFPVVK